MLQKIEELIGLDIVAEGGKIGTITDLLFDDQEWIIRYLVIDTGNWLVSRKVLISPLSLSESDSAGQAYVVSLTREQIENSPPISADEPVSRQHEIVLHAYYGLNPYFVTTRGPQGEPQVPLTEAMTAGDEEEETTTVATKEPDPHLRSAGQVAGYHIQATDEEIGHVEDFFVDDESWTVRYMVIDTRNWLPGKKVVLAKDWIEKVSWEKSKVFVSVSRETVKNSPEYIPSSPLTREYEMQLYKYYQRPTYWE